MNKHVQIVSKKSCLHLLLKVIKIYIYVSVACHFAPQKSNRSKYDIMEMDLNILPYVQYKYHFMGKGVYTSVLDFIPHILVLIRSTRFERSNVFLKKKICKIHKISSKFQYLLTFLHSLVQRIKH